MQKCRYFLYTRVHTNNRTRLQRCHLILLTYFREFFVTLSHQTRFHLDEKNSSVPFFLFGDFNFRCDTAGVVKELTSNLTAYREHSIKNESTKINYRNSDGNNILTVGKKEFSHADHQLKFKEFWLKEFDRELEPLKDILVEYPITFIPSYPFEEDPEMPTDYMATRCPSWCDRILMDPQMKDIIEPNEWKYDMIGESVCMGDHKPICLTVRLKPNKGTYRSYDCSCKNSNANNINDLTSPVQFKSFPYLKKHCHQNLNEDKAEKLREMSQNCQLQLDGKLSEYGDTFSGHGVKIIKTAVDFEEADRIQKVSSDYPSISINLIESDKICAWSRTPALLAENIIVNQIDTYHLYTPNKSHSEPYTPESNESHSPHSELKNTAIRSGCKIEPYSHSINEDNKNQDTARKGSEDSSSSHSVHAITEKQLKSLITPLQLRARLEELHKITIQTTDGDVISVKNCDTNKVTDMMYTQPFLIAHSPSFFF